MTVQQILLDLEPVKPISRKQLYVYFDKFNIRPLGIRQRPQHFPDDAPAIIRANLGLPLINPPRRRSTKIKPVKINSRRAR